MLVPYDATINFDTFKITIIEYSCHCCGLRSHYLFGIDKDKTTCCFCHNSNDLDGLEARENKYKSDMISTYVRHNLDTIDKSLI